MRKSILFGLLAMTGFMTIGQDAQAGCYRRHCGWGRSCYVSRCCAPRYGCSTCYTPTCYTPICTTSYAPVAPIMTPIVTTPVYSTATCGVNGLPQCTQLYFANR